MHGADQYSANGCSHCPRVKLLDQLQIHAPPQKTLHHDSGGLLWAMDQAMDFHRLPAEQHAAQVARIMRESAQRFNHTATARSYFEIYETMIKRPLVNAF